MNNKNNKLKKIDTIQKFSDIINNNLLYIDKTQQIYNLITSINSVFLKRPRRFWKSMLISTMKELFSWNSELFKGLYIYEHTDYDFEEYPIIFIDFSDFEFDQYNNKID
jgi:hypothetical protein